MLKIGVVVSIGHWMLSITDLLSIGIGRGGGGFAGAVGGIWVFCQY